MLEREEAQDSLDAAQDELEEQASLMYRSGDYGFVDVLSGSDSFSDFASRFGRWTRLLYEASRDVGEWLEQVD